MAFVCRMWLWLNNGMNKTYSIIRTSSQAAFPVRNWGGPKAEIFSFKKPFLYTSSWGKWTCADISNLIK